MITPKEMAEILRELIVNNSNIEAENDEATIRNLRNIQILTTYAPNYERQTLSLDFTDSISVDMSIKVNVCVSVQALYEQFGKRLASGFIDKRDDYYDLCDGWGRIVCCDGEVCEIIRVNAKTGDIILLNQAGEDDVTFTLSAEEFEVATFME